MYLPGLSLSSRLLLLGGPHHTPTEAAALFLIRPNALHKVCELFRVSKPALLPWFELVIEASGLGGCGLEYQDCCSPRSFDPEFGALKRGFTVFSPDYPVKTLA